MRNIAVVFNAAFDGAVLALANATYFFHFALHFFNPLAIRSNSLRVDRRYLLSMLFKNSLRRMSDMFTRLLDISPIRHAEYKAVTVRRRLVLR